jgi:beta-lactamase regulating signal transducer with metallopeptidase domain
MPLRPAAIVFCALTGWVAVEPDDAELMPLPVILLGVPFVAVWVRAAVRALWGLRHVRVVSTAATLGVFRPRVVIAPAFLRDIDDAARAAVEAHEAAHLNHRDPLRVWVAQLATDLQWPGRRAQQRFSQWRHALELARDEEVRRLGVDGADLAAAVIAALRFSSAKTSPAVSIVGHHHRVRDRIGRLLAPLPPVHQEPEMSKRWRASAMAAAVAAIVFGATCGEMLVQTLAHSIQ